MYTWSSSNPEVVFVSGNGVVTSLKNGKSHIIARDFRNRAHFGKADVYVASPIKLLFVKSVLESQVNSDVSIYIYKY